MKLISPLLVILMCSTFFVVRNYDRIIGKVTARIFLIFFFIAVVLMAFKPSSTAAAAHFLGVGRGADLVFYMTTVSFFALTAIVIFKFNSIEGKLVKIVREAAIKDFISEDQL